MRLVVLWCSLVMMAVTLIADRGQTVEAPAEIALTITEHRFEPEDVHVKAGAPFILVVTNQDPTAEEFESPELRLEKVIPAGKTVRLKMPALKPGTYRFLGEFHAQTAQGRLLVEER
jgi:heme/copper-type cytochrome/quinol oxidase subunit 2